MNMFDSFIEEINQKIEKCLLKNSIDNKDKIQITYDDSINSSQKLLVKFDKDGVSHLLNAIKPKISELINEIEKLSQEKNSLSEELKELGITFEDGKSTNETQVEKDIDMSRKEIVLGNTSTINSESIMKQLCQVKIECNDQLIESFDKKDSLVKYLLLRKIFLFDLMASIDKKEINVDEMISRLTIEANQIKEQLNFYKEVENKKDRAIIIKSEQLSSSKLSSSSYIESQKKIESNKIKTEELQKEINELEQKNKVLKSELVLEMKKQNNKIKNKSNIPSKMYITIFLILMIIIFYHYKGIKKLF